MSFCVRVARCRSVAAIAGLASGLATHVNGQNVATWGGLSNCIPGCDWSQVAAPQYTFAKIASANTYMAGIDADGFLHVWGCSGVVTTSAGLYSHVGAGENYHVALQAPSGVAEHFGNNAQNPHLDFPDSKTTFLDLSVGEYHSIGILKSSPYDNETQGNIRVWGNESVHYFQSDPGNGSPNTACNQGGSSPCYWPYNEPAPARFNLPPSLASVPIRLLQFKTVVAGAYNSAGILNYPDDPSVDGRLIVWGSNTIWEGQLVSWHPLPGSSRRSRSVIVTALRFAREIRL